MKTIRQYVEEKTIKRQELLENFDVVKKFEEVRGGLSHCGNCWDEPNTTKLPSEVWTVALYCWKCGAITMMYPADRMSGNHTDTYEVFMAKVEKIHIEHYTGTGEGPPPVTVPSGGMIIIREVESK